LELLAGGKKEKRKEGANGKEKHNLKKQKTKKDVAAGG
jgi:hypothetical protein